MTYDTEVEVTVRVTLNLPVCADDYKEAHSEAAFYADEIVENALNEIIQLEKLEILSTYVPYCILSVNEDYDDFLDYEDAHYDDDQFL